MTLGTLAVIAQLVIVIGCLVLGTRYGGLGLGLISGIGLVILVFGFHLKPGEPPVDVMLTILAVIGCAATLQTAGGLDVMMRVAERFLRKHPRCLTILAPVTTWFLTLLCGTGHVVYTMFPIIEDIALEKDIRPERPMAVSSVAAQVGITASPVSVATVSLAAIVAEHSAKHGGPVFTIPQILMVSIPASLAGVLLAALWSMRRGKDLKDDPAFQAKIADPAQREYIYSGGMPLLDKELPRTAYRATYIFLAAIAVVVLLGAFDALRPEFVNAKGKMTHLSMNLVIQMVMLVAGAIILITCKVKHAKIAESTVFKAGMTAIFSVFGVAWMAETFFGAHFDSMQRMLTGMVRDHAWTFAIALFLVSKLVNSQAAALVAMAPLGLKMGIDPVALVGFYGAAYGYFFLPTYPSDLACIGFDRTGTTRIGKYVLNHSFMVPGFICVITSCLVGTGLSRLLLG